MNDAEVFWTPGWEWLTAVVAIHVLAATPWLAHFGAWPLPVVCGSLAYHAWVFSRREVWRFLLTEETAVLFAPSGSRRRPLRRRGPVWMTERWVVVRTDRRVLMLCASRYEPARFARLRRALLRDAGSGWSTSSGSAVG